MLIVERGSRFRCFTPEGERILDWARRIVGDARAMRQEIEALKKGLSGHLRLAGACRPRLPASSPSSRLPIRQRYPAVCLSVLSMTSDAGDAEARKPRGRRGHFLRRYRAAAEVRGRGARTRSSMFCWLRRKVPYAKLEQITWAEAGHLPLCLLTRDMQNRRLIDRHLADAGVVQTPTLEATPCSCSTRTCGQANGPAFCRPALPRRSTGRAASEAISLVQPTVTHKLGLIVTRREPHSPLVQRPLSRTLNGLLTHGCHLRVAPKAKNALARGRSGIRYARCRVPSHVNAVIFDTFLAIDALYRRTK